MYVVLVIDSDSLQTYMCNRNHTLLPVIVITGLLLLIVMDSNLGVDRIF